MLKESELKESRGWEYKEIQFNFEEYKQISMFDKEDINELSKHKSKNIQIR